MLIPILLLITLSNQHKLENITSTETFDLIGQYAGKKAVLVNFWATWCAPCIEEFPGIVKLQKENRNNLHVIFISFDLKSKRQSVIEFLKKQDVDWTTYFKNESDDSFIQNMPEAFDGALPFSMIFKRNGEQQIYLTGKQDFTTFFNQVKQAIK